MPDYDIPDDARFSCVQCSESCRRWHVFLTPEEQTQTGVTDGYVRLSVGIEHTDDILADLDQAFAVV